MDDRKVAAAAANAAGMLIGTALDAALGDPRRWHPVAGYGRAAGALERYTYRPDRAAGVRHVAIGVGVPVAVAAAAHWATRRRPGWRTALVAATTWAVLGGTSLRREAVGMASSLEAGDLAAARERLPHLCGRDPAALDADGLARATVESLAENTSDAVVAPLAWGALAGLPGLVGYRVVNTLDAMVGHRTPRYERFGWAAARLDDAANLGPSRFAAALTVAAAPAVGGRRASALWTWLRYGHRHPSPNAGQCEAAMAGALGVSLGGRNVYLGQVDVRPVLGDGRRPKPDDIRRAAKLSGLIGTAAAVLCAGHALATTARRTFLRTALRLALHRTTRRAASGGATAGLADLGKLGGICPPGFPRSQRSGRGGWVR